MNKILTNKKGMSSGMIAILIALIIGILVLVIYGGGGVSFLNKFLGSIGEKAASFDEDCDRDGVPNEPLDRCPCIPRGENEDDKLTGCPAGTSVTEANNDRITCFQYEKDGKFTDECEKKDKKSCRTRCEEIHVEEITFEKKKEEGRAGDFDLVISKLEIDLPPDYERSEKRDLKVDAKGARQIEGKIYLKVTNTGGQEIIEDIPLRIDTCNLNKGDCKFKQGYTIEHESIVWKGNEGVTKSYPVVLGFGGDHCDGPKTQKCYLKIMVDRKKDGSGTLSETGKNGEKNNEELIYIIVDNQNEINFEGFETWKAILLNDDDGNKEVPKTVLDSCYAYFADQIDQVPDIWKVGVEKYVCDPERQSPEGHGCGDEYHRESPLRYAAGCWTELLKTKGEDDCGEYLAVYGATIDIANPQKITYNDKIGENGCYSHKTECDSIRYMVDEISWLSQPGWGSLLCSDNSVNKYVGGRENWVVCDAKGEGQFAILKDDRHFLCKDGSWEERESK